MSTPSCQISTPNRIVVFEYEVLKVFVCKSDTFFLVHPVEQRPGWKKYIIGETNAANSLVKVSYKNIKIKIFDLALSKKIAEKVFWVILPKISKGDKVSPRLSAMLT